MRVVSVSELKARLSHYLRLAKRGAEVQVLERGVPVARLVGMRGAVGRDDVRLDQLVRAGIVRRGTGDVSWIADRAPARVARGSLSAALQEDREDRV